MVSRLAIRQAVVADYALIVRLITELTRYEKVEHEVIANESDIRNSLFVESEYRPFKYYIARISRKSNIALSQHLA